MRKAMAAATVALLALTGCTGGGGKAGPESPSPTATASTGAPPDTRVEARAKKSLRSGMRRDAQFSLLGVRITHDQAGCIADEFVDNLGVDKLRRYGILDQNLVMQPEADPKSLAPADADAVAQSVTDCIDLGAFIVSQMGSLVHLTADQLQCMAGAVDENVFREQLSLVLQGKDGDLTTGMRADLVKCITPDQ
jgi:hypothetical protein